MKNKKTTYLLIPVALIVWGLIIYRIVAFRDSSPKVKYSNEYKNNNALANDIEINEDLILNYPDPFLKSSKYKKIDDDKEMSKAVLYQTMNEKKVKDYPGIIYWGMVKNNEVKERTISIRIEKKDYLMKSGERIEGVVLKKMSQDSIIVSYDNQLLVVRKN